MNGSNVGQIGGILRINFLTFKKYTGVKLVILKSQKVVKLWLTSPQKDSSAFRVGDYR